ncbi:JmjC domain-containing protein [Streptomyces sp. NPDC017435]|uniref:JmjC domain-containing protein n=1 Tax=Streptomyces sp. NPDC017435 TaxID=3364995 RepID=UPI0037994F36
MTVPTTVLLATIMGDEHARRFDDTWPDETLWHHGALERFAAVASLAGLAGPASVDEVLARYSGPVNVVGPPIIEASGGITDRFLVDAETARKWYDAGAALECDFLETGSPALNRACRQLRKELRLPEGALAKCIAYCAAKHAGFAPHFDAYVNFVLQLKGEKQWRLAPNVNAELPVQHYDLAEAPHLPEELRSYWTGEAPGADLPHAVDLTLRPGSALFVPRGAWHATAASGDTVSVNFTFSQPTRADVVLAALRRRMVSDPQWRRLFREGDEHTGITSAERVPTDLAAEDLARAAAEPLDLYQEGRAGIHQQLWQGRP